MLNDDAAQSAREVQVGRSAMVFEVDLVVLLVLEECALAKVREYPVYRYKPLEI